MCNNASPISGTSNLRWLGAAVLLMKAAESWKQLHGDLPSSFKERNEFKKLLSSWQQHIDGVPLEVPPCLLPRAWG